MAMQILFGALALTPLSIRTATRPLIVPSRASIIEANFARSKDLLSLGDKVSERAVVNVVGRWQRAADWDTIGIAAQLDAVLDGTATEYPEGLPVEATPRRRDFCKRQGVVQRYILNATVGLLPFTDDALAASVGCTAAELNAEPIDQLAVDVVFDALAESQSGIVGREECDARRAAFTAADGAFDAAAFADGLSRARRQIAVSYAIYPGIPNVIFAFVAYQLDAFSAATAASDDILKVVRENWETMGPMSLVLPVLPLALVAYGAANPPRSSKAASDAAALDRAFLKRQVSTRQRQDMAVEVKERAEEAAVEEESRETVS